MIKNKAKSSPREGVNGYQYFVQGLYSEEHCAYEYQLQITSLPSSNEK